MFITGKAIALSMTFWLCFFSTTTLFAQEEKRQVENFNTISYSLSARLEIYQGFAESVLLKGDPDDIQKIITKVENGELKIYTKNNFSHLGDIVILVTVKELNTLSVAGSGDVVFKTELKSSDFTINLSGSSDMICEGLSVKSTSISLSGSGDIRLGGINKGNLTIRIAGSGDVDAEELQSKDGEVNISGSGSVKIWATETLSANIVGSGDVYYKGNPRTETHISGSGTMKSL